MKKVLKSNRRQRPEGGEAWANSKLGLLIIGAMISGLLVPSFQYTQRFFEWKRQKQYENYIEEYANQKLLLKEFIGATVYISESQELLQDYLNFNNAVSIDKKELLDKLNQLQAERFQANAKIEYLIYIIKNEKLEKAYFEGLKASQQYVLDIKETIIHLKSGMIPLKSVEMLIEKLSAIEENIDTIIKNIKETIDDTNRKNENFHLF